MNPAWVDQLLSSIQSVADAYVANDDDLLDTEAE